MLVLLIDGAITFWTLYNIFKGALVKSKIVDFYLNNGKDARGRTLTELLDQDFDELEQCHDYIQWLFPVPEPSAYSPDAPLLAKEDIEAFKASKELSWRIGSSFGMMLEFYGLCFYPDGNIVPSSDFETRAAVWLSPRNHNYLRLTRILRSLTLLGEQNLALKLLSCLEGIYSSHGEVIGPVTIGFWRKAAYV